jgi:ABC-type transporter Mla maintaining outer membrane lipid asymmetry ATPase subunit MlaF
VLALMHVQLGTNVITGEGITLAEVDRRQHLYCVGGSGVGKTNWLLSLMAQDLAAEREFCFIDKHGDAAKQLADTHVFS